MMIDVEHETLQEYPEIGTLIKSLNLPMLLSWHDFKSTPSEVELAELLGQMSPSVIIINWLLWQIH